MPTIILCGLRLDDATMTLLKDSNPKPYIGTRIVLALALAWRTGCFSRN